MKAILFFFILLLSFGHANAQKITHLNVDSLAAAQAKQLITEKEVEQVLSYESGCLGCVYLREVACNCEDNGLNIHLVWVEGQKYFTKEIGCCVNDEVKEFGDPVLYKDLVSNKGEIFNSEFKAEYEEMHHGYNKLTLFSASGKQEVYMEDFLFAQDNEYKEHNLKQPAKVFSDKLSKELRME